MPVGLVMVTHHGVGISTDALLLFPRRAAANGVMEVLATVRLS